MGLLTNIGYEAARMLLGFPNFTNIEYGIFDPEDLTSPKNQPSQPQNLSTIFMCARILSSAVSMMPLEVTKNGMPYKDHDLYFQLRHRINDKNNNQSFWSTIEYMRNIYGNAFVDIRKNKFSIIPIEVIDDWDYKGPNEGLRYHLNWSLENDADKKREKVKKEEWVLSKNILHFKGISADGVMGLPPVSAAIYNMKIMDKATNTIINFYDNSAMSPMSVETELPDNANLGKLMIEESKRFKNKYTGVPNKGKPIFLPPNTKLTPLQIHFADAELISTLRFTRDEICNLYGIPSFMTNSTESVQMDIEQQSMNFKTFTISPISKIYESELEFKLLNKKDLMDDIKIHFDTKSIVDSDFKAKAESYTKLIQSGVCSPNEAAKDFGFKPLESEYGDEKYVQAQLIPLSRYNEINPIINKQKTNNGDNKKE